jgi:pentapeptide MXKDX repeat protein
MRCDQMRCDEMRCDELRCDAMWCDAMRWEGIRWDGMWCDAMGRDAMRWDGMGWDEMGMETGMRSDQMLTNEELSARRVGVCLVGTQRGVDTRNGPLEVACVPAERPCEITQDHTR